MKIKHSSNHYLSEIRQRLKIILILSDKNIVDSTRATSVELMADNIPSARQISLDHAQSIRKKIEGRKSRIEVHKNWIEDKCPGFFKKVSFVQKYVTTWDLDLSAVRFPPSRENQNGLTKRKTIMNQWYCFFFGDSHLKSTYVLHNNE